MFPSNLLLDRENLFLYVHKYVDQKQRLGCHVGHKEDSRCCTRGESEESITHRRQSTQVTDPPLL